MLNELNVGMCLQGLEPETFQTVANKYYDARMKLLGALDFDEMLALVEHLLDTNVEACGIARKMYQHLLVDEFQVCSQAPAYVTTQLGLLHG